jgi:hypothetical protein
MAILGIITNEGVTKSIALLNEQGYKILPYRFAVSEQIGGFNKFRDLASILPTWYDGLISNAVRISPNTIQFSCNIPAGTAPEPRYTREVYVIAKDENDDDFLLGLGHPSSELTYDPEGELRIRIQFTIDNIDIADLYTFLYTQATEIEDHNNDSNAHPVLRQAMNKAGIYIQQPLNRFNGQNFDGFPTKAISVVDKSVVFWNTLAARYENAIAIDNDPRRFAVGFYDQYNNIVVSKGIIDYPHSLSPYTPVFLSDTLEGQASIAQTSVRVGFTLPNNRLMVDVAIDPDQEALNFDGDLTITLIPPLVRELTLEDENGVRWDVKINNDGLLFTVPNSLREPEALFRIPKIDLSYGQVTVKTDGELKVFSPPTQLGLTIDQYFYLASPNGVAWKFTVNLANEIVMQSYQNAFLVRSEIANHFAVKQYDIESAFVCIHESDNPLPVSPVVPDTLVPTVFKKFGNASTLVSFHNGHYGAIGASVGDVKDNMLDEATFQQLNGTAWVEMRGQDITGSLLAQLTGMIRLPDQRGKFRRSSVFVPNVNITAANVNITTEEITVPNHKYSTGFKVLLTGTLPSPLAISTVYFVISINANTIKLATTLDNALSGTAINLTTTGGNATIVQWEDPDQTTRTLHGGGLMGSLQQDEFKSHTHTYRDPIQSMQSTNSNGWESHGGTRSTGAAGGNETRPVNRYFTTYIKIN